VSSLLACPKDISRHSDSISIHWAVDSLPNAGIIVKGFGKTDINKELHHESSVFPEGGL